MVSVPTSLFIALSIISLASAGHCVDEKNDFRVTDFVILESRNFPNQATVSISGFFKESQFVNYVSLDYTLDGSNWQKSHTKVIESFGADEFGSFLFTISTDGPVTEHAHAVFSVVEDTDIIWCDLIQIASKYSSRQLVD